MKAFTHFFVLSVFACLMFQSCFVSFKTITGNGNLIRKEVPVSDYNEISLNISADIFYDNDTIAPPYLQIYTDENILPHINVGVKDGRLTIDSEDGVNLRATTLRIFTNSGNLNAVDVSGSGNVHLRGQVNAGEMRMNISGSGSVGADSLYCERTELDVSGSGSAKLRGVSNYSEFNVSGSGSIYALEFSSLEADASVSGSGMIKLWVGRKLDASVSGSGNIQYKGNPETKNTQVSGSGHITTIEF